MCLYPADHIYLKMMPTSENGNRPMSTIHIMLKIEKAQDNKL